jgi:predicted phosphodiesterase
VGSRGKDVRSVIEGPYAFVGDLHGRYRLLQGILDRDKSKKYHYVLLGDILHHKPFFKRHRPSSPLKILRMTSNLIEKGKGTLILGNNENYVLRSLIMPEKKIKKKELLYTLECLKSLEM